MTSLDIAWAAGLYEGEGSLTNRLDRGTWQLGIKSTDFDVLHKFMNIFDVGNIRFCQEPSLKSNWKPIWQYSVCNKAGMHKILTAVLPHLGSRRAYKALNFLDYFDKV